MASWKRIIKPLVLCILVLTGSPAVAYATGQASSPNYSVDQVFFGTGGELHACSTSYCSKQAAGSLNVGQECSTNYCAQTGSNTDRVPSLTFLVNTTSVNFGVITPGIPATATATFSVKSYLSSGYVVQVYGNPPTNGGHTLNTCLSVGRGACAFSSSREQFGLNLVANTIPTSFGANPVQVPDSSFGFGVAEPNYYATSNDYNYSNIYNTIAESLSSSGETDYTISYLINVTPTTPGGTYTTVQNLVATSTF